MKTRAETAARILLIEDNTTYADKLAKRIKWLCPTADVRIAASSEQCQSLCGVGFLPTLALVDHHLRGGRGLEVAKYLRVMNPSVQLVLMTAYAMDNGTKGKVYEDYLESLPGILIKEKGQAFRKDLPAILAGHSCFVSGELAARVEQLKQRMGWVSPVMSDTAERICKFAASMLPILILGDSGTGKTELARAIHDMYNAVRGTSHGFVPVTCTTVQDTLALSDLFGHERGAFTGAHARRLGYFETAGAGTIFLDEIGHVPLEFQRRLLEVVETGTFRRLGGQETHQSTARLITATWAPLQDLVKQKSFDPGLADRLSVVVVRIPPLNVRKNDLIPTANAILRKLCPSKTLSASAEHELVRNKWPGNARQLRKVLEYALQLLGAQSEIGPSHVRDAIASTSIGEDPDAASPRLEIPNGSNAAKPATTPGIVREGDAIWRAWTAGKKLFACEKSGAEYSLRLLTKGGVLTQRVVNTKEKPALFRLWADSLGDVNLARAAVIRIIWETSDNGYFCKVTGKDSEQKLDASCILAKIGDYVDVKHALSVRSQITNVKQNPKYAIAIYKATHRDSEYLRLMQRYFSDAPSA